MKKVLLWFGAAYAAIALAKQMIPQQADLELGRRLLRQYIEEMGIRPSPQSERIQSYLQRIADRLTPALPNKDHYTVSYDPNPAFKSAFALPGNQVVFGGGLLAIAEKEDEIASVLAHEVEHSELHQVAIRTAETERQQHTAADRLAVSVYYGHYTKTQELLCDRDGAQLVQAAGYSPEGLLTLLKTFQALRKGEPETATTDTPTLSERIRQMDAMFAAKALRSRIPQKAIAWP